MEWTEIYLLSYLYVIGSKDEIRQYSVRIIEKTKRIIVKIEILEGLKLFENVSSWKEASWCSERTANYCTYMYITVEAEREKLQNGRFQDLNLLLNRSEHEWNVPE